MIEESGPPGLATLASWPIIAERFRDYLRKQNLKPADLLSRAALLEAMKAGKTSDDDLWPLVTLPKGTPEDAAEHPLLFYHAKYFAGILFCDNCAEAVKLVEQFFPKGSVANAGAFFPQEGHAVRRNWYDEFMLFRRRGMTAWGSEMTWALCGIAHYVGAQSESYEGALARGVAKYHDAVLGPTHLLASGIYGYNADYVETAAYALAAQGQTSLDFYDSTQNGTYNIDPEIRMAMKRFAYAMGAIETMQTESKVVPSKVALGWSETTAIWDQAEPTHTGRNMPGNVMYQLERHYLYLLLRHLQLPVDLLCDNDLEEGYLKDYEVYVLVGDHLTAKAAEALRNWVEAGGVLVSVAGGGLWDEYNRPLDTLKDVYGIKGARQYAKEQGAEYVPGAVYGVNPADNRLVKQEQSLRAKVDLIHAHPMDQIALASNAPAARLPVLGYRQGFAVEGGTAQGTFQNGEAAVVMNSYGKGRALIMGFLPGIGNLYQAFPKIPYGRGGEDLSLYLYPDCKPAVRDGLAYLMRQVWPAMGATVTCSNPYVEANLLRQKNGAWHVALVNFSGQPVKDLTVRIRAADVGGASRVMAAFGKAKTRQEGGDLVVTLPLAKFDWLTLN